MALLSPIQNELRNGKQVRPKINQRFGEDASRYKKFGLKGHNGIDFDLEIGTPIYAPMHGEVIVRNSQDGGYGLHIKIRNALKASECVLAHLSRVAVSNGQFVNMGDLIGWGGNTGYSTGPHLHFGYRRLISEDGVNLFKWRVQDFRNGYAGYVDVLDYLVTWRGGFLRDQY